MIDAGWVNRLFKKAPWCPLGSIESLCRVRIPKEEALLIAQEYVTDLFYRLGIDKDLPHFFYFRPSTHSILMEAFLAHGVAPPAVLCSHEPSVDVTPALCVLHMGFTWAFWLSQQAHLEIAHRSLTDVEETRYVTDRVPAANLLTKEDYSLLLYADNANHLGLDAEEVNRRRNQLSIGLNCRGLFTHEVVEACDLAESLGVEVSGRSGDIRPTPVRLRRLRGGLRCVVRGRAISGKDLERILGHITFTLLLNRPLLSCLNCCYEFVQHSYSTVVPVWGSVKRELQLVLDLLIFAHSNLKLE